MRYLVGTDPFWRPALADDFIFGSWIVQAGPDIQPKEDEMIIDIDDEQWEPIDLTPTDVERALIEARLKPFDEACESATGKRDKTR